MTKHIIIKFLAILVGILSIVFLIRFALNAQFNNSSNSDFIYNSTDNLITNLDEINATTQGLFKFFQSMNTYFNNLFNSLTSYDIFNVLANETKDIWVLGAFFNFMSQVFTIIVYIFSLIVTIFQYFFDIIKYIFTVEQITVDTTTVSIPGIG